MSWRMLAFAGGALGVIAVGGAVVWGVSRSGPRTIPVIEADSRPVKVRPEDPGGLRVPNQDQLVLEPAAVRRAAERSTGANARLDRGPEAPALDLLRQQAAPPAAPLPPPVAAAPDAPAQVAVAPSAPAPALPPPVAAAPVAPQPVAAVAAPVLAPVAQGRALVQLGALASEEAARSEWERLTRRVPELAAFHPRITRLEREGQATLYRLRTGGLADAAAARSLCEAVRAKGGACTAFGG
ncbi:SPOR domain-containing protein [Siccirubricoccus deserti]